MEAPGDCSPSRKRGVEYDDAVLLGLGLRGHGNISFCSCRAARAPSGCVRVPLSAQARTPSRPSGAPKEQDPKHKGGIRPGRCSPPSDRADIAPHRHAVTLVTGTPGGANLVKWAHGPWSRFALRSGYGVCGASCLEACVGSARFVKGRPRTTSAAIPHLLLIIRQGVAAQTCGQTGRRRRGEHLRAKDR